jgi:P-type Cu2+ transporter
MAQHFCIHCGLAVPAGMVDEASDAQFCCNGCKLVYTTIHAEGLDQFYEIKKELKQNEPGKTTDRHYGPFDDASFLEQYVTRSADGLAHIDLYLEGVHCAACVWLIEKLPQVLEGVIEARLDLRRQVARITRLEQEVPLSRIARTLDSLGYPVHPYRASRLHELKQREQRRHFIQIAVSGACMMNVMVISFALYGGMFSRMQLQYQSFLRWAGLIVTLVAVLGPGKTFFIGAISSWRTRVMHMDLPVAIALTAGTAWGAINTITGQGEVYFESITAIIFLLLIGRWIQQRQQRTAQEAVELLFTLQPSVARLVEAEGQVREVPIEAIKPGATVEVRAGDTIPADGVILEGQSTYDISLLTGESRPISLLPGEPIHAGTNNLSTPILMRVETTGGDTRVGRLMRMVEQFARQRPPIVRLADRVAHFFVIGVLTLAAATLALWLVLTPDEPTLALEHAMAMLIVTCPCALGLATPLAMVVAIGQAANRGILIKGGQALEQLNVPGLVLLDKTGTITRGQIRLVRWQGAETVKPLVVAIEKQVAHPIAKAFLDAFDLSASGSLAIATDEGKPDGSISRADSKQSTITHIPGHGVHGVVAGQTVLVGSESWIAEQTGATSPDWIQRLVTEYAEGALSPVLVAVEGQVVGVAGFGDPVLEDAADSIGQLRQLGWSVGIISGDHDRVVEAVARQVGIDQSECTSRADPEQKAERVARAREAGPTIVMVGDGVNDAAALSTASVGIAVHGGAEASLAAADIFLNRSGLGPIVELMHGAKRTIRVIGRNLAVSLAYNIVAASLTMAGLINPLIAAILMPLSSISVVTISYRSRIFNRP